MPSDTLRNIFDANDYRKVKTLLRDLNSHQELIDKSRKCGINCDNEDIACQAMKTFCETLIAEFMTPPPPGVIESSHE